MADLKDTNLSDTIPRRTKQFKSYTRLSKGLGQRRATVCRNAPEEITSRPGYWCM